MEMSEWQYVVGLIGGLGWIVCLFLTIAYYRVHVYEPMWPGLVRLGLMALSLAGLLFTLGM